MKLDKGFYIRKPVTQIAKELLGKYIYTRINGLLTGGIITETEAYAGITDKASHAYNNLRSKRTEIMYSEGGVAYVYLCYGVHHLFNFVTNAKDIPDAVLLRGIYPTEGISVMEKRLQKKFRNKVFTNGPGKVSKALGIKTNYTGENLMGENIWVEDKKYYPKESEIATGARIGVDYAEEDAGLPYRFVLNKKSPARMQGS